MTLTEELKLEVVLQGLSKALKDLAREQRRVWRELKELHDRDDDED